jgi:tetratricopeptide (TPR) repeat protein
MVAHARAAIACDADMPETYAYLMLQDSLSFGNAYDENTKWHKGDPNEELFLVARAIHRIRTKGLDETSDLKDVGPLDNEGRPLHAKVITDYSQRFPHNVELLAYRLERSIAKDDVEAAAGLLTDLPAEAEGDNRFCRYRGWLRMARGELAEAEACYRKALELNCYDHVSRHQLASVLRQSKRMEGVKALEEVAVEGKNLRNAIFHAPAVNKVPRDVLGRMAQYAKHCGDTLVADKLESRLQDDGGPAANGTTTGQTAKKRGS